MFILSNIQLFITNKICLNDYARQQYAPVDVYMHKFTLPNKTNPHVRIKLCIQSLILRPA